jgi:predicted ribosomally synthesized peptide with SipW-like signal peptide
MKRVKFIALMLVLALVMLGAAYAAWTDTLTVNATVNTGEVEMKFVSIATWGTGGNTYLTSTHTGHNTNTATWTISNLYPDAKVSLAMFAKNTGSIPVKLDDVNLTLSDPSSGIWDYVMAEVRVRKLNAGAQWDYILPNSPQIGLLRDLDVLIKDAVADTEFEPGSQVRFGTEDQPGSIIIWLHEDTPNQYQNATFDFSAEMVWKQWNLVP